MFYQDVFRGFEAEQIRYLIVGAIAMNLHGAPRMTADLDILADMDRGNLSRLLETVDGLGYYPRLPMVATDLLNPENRQRWIKEKGLIAFTFAHPKLQYQEIDLLLTSPVSFDDAYADKVEMTVESVRIPVAAIWHLIDMKKQCGRAQDLSDIKVLERIQQLKSGRPTHD